MSDIMQHRIRKYVSVRYNSIIPELGNIQGPIKHPTWLPIDVIKKLLVAGRKPIYEHCITDPDKRVKLNLENYDDFNMFPGNTAIEDPSIEENTYLVTVKDDQEDDNMAPGFIYVEIEE